MSGASPYKRGCMQDKEENLTVIKRYQNRKLYDTRHSCYVTLDDIAQMVKHGEDIKVIDNRSKEDITSVTFAQIIFEEEKKKKRVLPLAAFKKIIQSGGEQIEQLFGLVQKSISHGVSSISQAKEEAEKAFSRIKEEIAHPDLQDLTKKVDQKIRSTLENVHIVSQLQHEVKRLREKIGHLEDNITHKTKKDT